MNHKVLHKITLHPHHRVHLLFGANTDVGKSIVSAGLIRAAASSDLSHAVHYIKPLQCGGSDQSFVTRHCQHILSGVNDNRRDFRSQTLFSWMTPASPHLASRWENLPVSDLQVVSALRTSLENNMAGDDSEQAKSSESIKSTTIIETAGGTLSPSSSSPLNQYSTTSRWGWSTQADLYSSLNIPVVFIGDGKLGGISVTLTALEALSNRGYRIDAVIFLEGNNNCDEQSLGSDSETNSIQYAKGNAEALYEYILMQDEKKRESKSLDLKDAIISLPPVPPMRIPLEEWYINNHDIFLNVHHLLNHKWYKYNE